MHIFYIHGANATPKSFSFIKQNLPEHTFTDFQYDASKKLTDTIARAASEITTPCHIVAHSLGGVVAVAAAHLVDRGLVKSITTISTPFGGSEAADRFRLVMPFNTFFKNIRTSNPILKAIQTKPLPSPTLNIITTGGRSPFEPLPNDGVVTIASQQILTHSTKAIVPYTHFEVLLDAGVVDIVSEFIQQHK